MHNVLLVGSGADSLEQALSHCDGLCFESCCSWEEANTILESGKHDLVISNLLNGKDDSGLNCPKLMFKPAFAWENGVFYQNPPGWDFTRRMLLDCVQRVLQGKPKRRAVVVDDEISIRNALKTMLERFGFLVTVLGDRSADTQLFQDGEIDLVLMDVNMPGISWEEYTDSIRQVSPSTIIYLATGDRELVLDDSVSGVLYKPFGLGEVAEIAAQTLELPRV